MAKPPETIAPFYAWLASDRARVFSGNIYSVSGMHLGEFEWPQESVYAAKAPQESAAWTVAEIEQAMLPGQ